MSKRIRFHLDEHVDPVVALALRQHGIDVSTTIDAGLRTASDHAQLEFIRGAGRVMVTHDADFLRMAAQGVEHPGIAFCGKAERPTGTIIRQLILIFEILEPAEIANRVEFL